MVIDLRWQAELGSRSSKPSVGHGIDFDLSKYRFSNSLGMDMKELLIKSINFLASS